MCSGLYCGIGWCSCVSLWGCSGLTAGLCMCIVLWWHTWLLLLTVVLSVIIAVLSVGVSSANNKMPTMDFSTPEQPPGDTRRKVSVFLGSGCGCCMEMPVLCWLVCYASALLFSQLELKYNVNFFFFLFYLWCFRFHPGKSLLCILKSRKVSSGD